MRTTIPCALGTLMLLVPTATPAQNWSLVGTAPAVSFGLTGELLTHLASGWLGFDEGQGAMLRLGGAGWTASATAVPPRQLATLTGAGTKAFLFGGLLGTGLGNDVWGYTDATGIWTQLSPGGIGVPGPSPRFGCRAVTMYGGYVHLFFGGSDGNGWPPDTWVLNDLGIGPWWVLQATPAALVGRMWHAMAAGPGNSVVLFGGEGAAAVLGDTWVFRGVSWTQVLGTAPPPAVHGRMTYDSGRDMTVLLHPNGDTWEWNDFTWRRVGATGAPLWSFPAVGFDPGPGGGVRAFQPTGSGLETHAFAPSPADYQITLDMVCYANGPGGLTLEAFQRSLPVLGQTLHLRATGMFPSAWFFGGYELSAQPWFGLGCGCVLGLTGVGTLLQFVPGTTTQRDWLLPVPNDLALVGVPIDAQGVVLDAAAPCLLMTTQRGTLVPGL